jgi:uncharacterized hydrophobic protein (TIGR00341 family)
MDLRLIDIMLPREYESRLDQLLEGHEELTVWRDAVIDGRLNLRILLPAEKTEGLLDCLGREFKGIEGFRILLLSVEASIPRLESQEQEKDSVPPVEEPPPKKNVPRIGREELYEDIEKTAHLSWLFVTLVILSTAVASIGILRSSVVAIIGAMVIAPLLGPNVALSLSTTLGDIKLARRAIQTIAAGIAIALVFSSLLGRFQNIDPRIPEIMARTRVSFGDIILALAAGSAAALSYTSGLMNALIGVMVAVALLPPLVTLGLLLGSGHWSLAYGALLLLLTNLICVNLSGVIVFLALGIRPLSWWEAEKAKKATRRAILLWLGLLAVLILLVILSRK